MVHATAVRSFVGMISLSSPSGLGRPELPLVPFYAREWSKEDVPIIAYYTALGNRNGDSKRCTTPEGQ